MHVRLHQVSDGRARDACACIHHNLNSALQRYLRDKARSVGARQLSQSCTCQGSRAQAQNNLNCESGASMHSRARVLSIH